MLVTEPRLVPVGGFRVLHQRLIGSIYLYLDGFDFFIGNVIVSHHVQCRIDRPVGKVTARILLEMGSRRKDGRGPSQVTSHAAKVSTPWAGELVTKRLRRLKYLGICGHPVGGVLRSLNRLKSRNPQLQIVSVILLGTHTTGVRQSNTKS